MKKFLPILLALLGTGAGVGAGLFLMPPPAEPDLAAAPCGEVTPADTAAKKPAKPEAATQEYVKMNNQFVVPIVLSERVRSLVVMTISLEVTPGSKERVYAIEPKLRDGFLQVLFDHANSGGFEGAFTNATTMETLRRSLQEVAGRVLGDMVSDVLITDIARQDV